MQGRGLGLGLGGLTQKTANSTQHTAVVGSEPIKSSVPFFLFIGIVGNEEQIHHLSSINTEIK